MAAEQRGLLNTYPDVTEPLLDDVRHAAGAWAQPLEHRPAVDTDLNDTQAGLVRRTPVLSVCKRACDHLLKQACAPVRLELEDRQGVVHTFAADQVGQRPHLRGANASVLM